MAVQTFCVRICGFMNSNRVLLTSRLPQFTQIAGVKQKFKDALKELKVPDKPKRPLTPYFRFVQDRRQSLLKQYPDWKITQIAAQCAAEWKKVDVATKEKYSSKFQEDMEKYAEDFSNYANKLTDEQKKAVDAYNKDVKESKVRRERKKKIRELEKPKKPAGAYIFFVKEQASLNPKKSYVELLTSSKGKWSELPAGEKMKYTQAAAKAKEQYEIDIKQWELKMIEEGNMDLVRQSTLTGKPTKSSKRE